MDRFESMIWNRGQGVWILGNKGAVNLVKNDKSTANWEWHVFPFDFQIDYDHSLIPYVRPNGKLFCRVIPDWYLFTVFDLNITLPPRNQ